MYIKTVDEPIIRFFVDCPKVSNTSVYTRKMKSKICEALRNRCQLSAVVANWTKMKQSKQIPGNHMPQLCWLLHFGLSGSLCFIKGQNCQVHLQLDNNLIHASHLAKVEAPC